MGKNNPLEGAYHKVHFLKDEGFIDDASELSEAELNNIEESGVCSDSVVTFSKLLTKHHVGYTRSPIIPAEKTPSQVVINDICEVNFLGHTYYFGVVNREGNEYFDGVFLKVMDKMFDLQIGHVFTIASEVIRIGVNGRGTINLDNLSAVFDLAVWRLL